MYSIAFKNGIDEKIDQVIAEIPSNNIPIIGAILTIKERQYLVREINHNINLSPFKEWIFVYVIEIQ